MARALTLSIVALALASCAAGPLHVHRGVEPEDHFAYLVRALNSDNEEREDLWRDASREPPGEVATLHRALLRTVPGHSGWDLAAGESELQGLLAQSPSYHVAPVVRARLEDLRTINAYRHEVDQLKRRLSKVADIEKRMDQERR
jgi:hypothetical protein